MKKYILSLIAVFCVSLSATAQKVYIAPSKSAIAYHKSKDCSYLRNSKNVTDITTKEAKEMGRHPCVRCYPAQAEATKKAIAKEQAEKKAATTKAIAATKVYAAAGGTKYHKTNSCTALAKSKNVKTLTLADAKKDLTPCSVCYAAAKKAAPKPATTKKVEAEDVKKAQEDAAKKAEATKATGTSKVYVAAGGAKYHKKKSCTALAKSKNIKTVTLAEAKANMTPCSVCYTSAKKTATKASTTPKKATEKKATEKKTTTKKAA